MHIKCLMAIVLFCANIIITRSKRYDNFILYKATPVEPDHLIFFQNLDRKKYIDVVFWKKPNKLFEDVHFIVNPSDKELLLERAQHFNLDLDVLSENIQRAFDSQIVKNYLRLRVESYSWTNYHNLVDIYQWLADLALKNPSVTGLMSIGKSAEDRDIFVIGINRSGAKSKVIVEGGMHGNEWISTEFLLYLAYNLIMSNRTANERLFELSKNYHWYLLPVCNPDGYEFSHNEDRLWMRNRRNVGHGYFGVDLNRNFDYKFGKHNIIPNSKDDSYGGPVPFSEPESRVIRDFVTKESEGLKYYFSFHAYGQKIVIPYSESKNNMEHDELDNLGKQAIIKMFRTSGVKYSISTGYGTRIAGNSAAWVKKNHKVKYVYTFFLRDNGTYGHALPPDQIQPTCEEALSGLVELMTAKPKRVRSNLFSPASRAAENLILLPCLAFIINCIIQFLAVF
ncbi:carboxypeptidase B [Bombyx mori]|uniref:Peptidase M14 domain-containing protein n=1 Tax=Bombyx mori TaxID=7091 RepID=A0A8R2RAQ5_BOMMO|nr:carboxypeptidase B [Bombyx mori]